MKPIIETKNLTKKFGKIIAVDNLNLIVNEGELFALLGINGAGKTTTIKMLSCLLSPTIGDAVVFNNSIKDKNSVKPHINISPQENAISENLTVYENLELIADIYKIPNKNEKIEEVIERFKLNEYKKIKGNKLSGGYKRRLSVAMSLMTEPKVLFLDEPTLGLDVLSRHELWKILKEIKKQTTIILTTHYLEEAEILSDRIGIMIKGKLIESSPLSDLKIKYKKDKLEDIFIHIAEGVEN